MKWDMHSPLELSERGNPAEEPVQAFLHAHLWISAHLAPWETSISGHVHVVTRLDRTTAASAKWELIDLSGHPLVVSERQRGLPQNADQLFNQLMDQVEIPVFRVRSLGAASRPGESLEQFRARIFGMLQPHVLGTDGHGLKGGARAVHRGQDFREPALASLSANIEEAGLRPLRRYATFRQGGLLFMSSALWETLVRHAATLRART